MTATPVSDPGVAEMLARLKSYHLPGGETAARAVRGIRTLQRGEFRPSPDARWSPFTAKESVDATRSGFCWTFRMAGGLFGSVEVTDAYEGGRGRLIVRKGPLTLQKLTGPDVDKGELQRYLGYIGYCPAILVNHSSLDFETAGPMTLRILDRQDQTGAAIEMEIHNEGFPICVRAVRPMTVGKKVIMTPWSARGTETREVEGMRMWTSMEAAWHLKEGTFTYVRIEVTSVSVLR